MLYRLIVLLMVFCCLTNLSTSHSHSFNPKQPESLLAQRLLTNHDPEVRPVLSQNATVVVHVMFTPIRIDDLDLRGEDWKMTGWLGITWTNALFRWDPQHEGEVKSLLLSHRNVWIPPISILNSLKGIFISHDQTHYSKVQIRSDGRSRFVLADNFATSCDVNINNFPFDSQTCELTVVSTYHSVEEMKLTSDLVDVDMTHYKTDGEWRVKSVDVISSTHNYSMHSLAQEEVAFSRVSFSFSVVRRPFYYVINVLLPCLMLAVLVLINFLLPPDSGEKVSLGITVLLAFTVFQLLIAEIIPTSSSETPLIAIYLLFVMATSAASVMMSVLVLNLHHRAIYSHPPIWLRRLVLDVLARALCMPISHVTHKIRPIDEREIRKKSPRGAAADLPAEYSKDNKKTDGKGKASEGEEMGTALTKLAQEKNPATEYQQPDKVIKIPQIPTQLSNNPSFPSITVQHDATYPNITVQRETTACFPPAAPAVGAATRQDDFGGGGGGVGVELPNAGTALQGKALSSFTLDSGQEECHDSGRSESDCRVFNLNPVASVTGARRTCREDRVLGRTMSSDRDINRSITASRKPESLLTLLPLGSKSAAFLMQSIHNMTHQQAPSTGIGDGREERTGPHRSLTQLELLQTLQDVFAEMHTARLAGELERLLENEWKLIARVVDRFFFWITVVTLFTTTAWVLTFSVAV